MRKYRVSGFEVWEYEEAESTNTLAEGMAPEELKDKRVILSYRQTRGRGQLANRWESEPGRNIAMTLVFRPEGLEAGRQFAVSMAAALGCADFLAARVGGVAVKWPNDVYVGDRKIAGILIEHRIAGSRVQCSLCGVGLNVNQRAFVSDAPNPVSLFQLTGRELPLGRALEGLLLRIGERYGQIGRYELLERDFMCRLYRSEGVHDWEDGEGRFRARIAGVDEYGQLVLEDTAGRRRVYAFKEVRYL